MTDLSKNHILQSLTLRQLQIFEAVVRLQGYTKAAEALHLSQPTVSMQVKKLCETLGCTTFGASRPHGSPHRAAGRDVYATAREVLGGIMALEDLTSAHKGVVKGGPQPRGYHLGHVLYAAPIGRISQSPPRCAAPPHHHHQPRQSA